MDLRPNKVKQKLANGELAYIIAGLTNADDIDAFGPNGFDGVWLEGEHGSADATNLGDLTRVCAFMGYDLYCSCQSQRPSSDLPHIRLWYDGYCGSTCQHKS